MGVLSNLKPEKVFEFFEWISSVPHGSGNTKKISDLLVTFAKERGLKYVQDDADNVIIYKPASKGYENSDTFIIQGHMDMVCEKDDDCVKDMAVEGIDIKTDGDYVWADKTSLGGDDCIAVAMAMAVLDDDLLQHPAIEAVFTTDEETGMNGASELDYSLLRGKKMLNLDSEEEGVFTVGCAGGMTVNAELPVAFTEVPADYSCINIEISGLLGGHSGAEIDKGRANAAKLMGRLLFNITEIYKDVRLVSFEGGKFDNVIMSLAASKIAIPSAKEKEIIKFIEDTSKVMKTEFEVTDPGISVKIENSDKNARAVSEKETESIAYVLMVIPQGVQVMSADFEGLVQTSLNLGVVKLSETEFDLTYSIRSSVRSQKEMLFKKVKAVVEREGGKVFHRNSYPEWTYRRESSLRETVISAYEDLFGKGAKIEATHGGLECGLFSEKIPGIDIVAFGPDLKDIHSPRERLSVASTKNTYELLKEILKRSK